MTALPRLTIAIVSDAIHPYHKGGKENRIHHLATGLAAQGHDVHIYTMKWWDGPKDRVENGVHLHAIAKLRPLYQGERRSIAQALFFSAAILKLVTAKFDLLEVDHMPYFPLFTGKIVSLIKRKPLFATWHEVWGRQYWQQYLGPVAGLIAYAMERLTVYMPDHVIAVSPFTAERLRTMLHARRPISLVPNGIQLQRLADIAPAKTTSDLIFTGRLLAHKNVDNLIRAVAIIKATRPDIRCLIVGDGPERTNLEQLARQLKVKSNLTFTGFVRHDDDVMAYLKASRVFVHPSIREGFGIVALEAMACNLPVVTTNHPDNAARLLITPDTGRVAEPTPESLATAIMDLLDAQSAARPADTAASYDWQLSSQNLAKVYQS